MRKRSPSRKSPLQAARVLLLAWMVASAGCFSAPSEKRETSQHNAAPSALANAAPVLARFHDVTSAVGLRFQHRSFKTPRKYFVETMGSGCAFLDYDADGWQDILLLNNAPLPGASSADKPQTMALYRNQGNGAFIEVTRQVGLGGESVYAMGVAVGDYDNDGHDDFYVTAVLGPSRLYHNESGKRFREVAAQAGVANAGRWGTSCAWLDYDKDGKLDLLACTYVKYASLADDKPCYAGSKHERVYCTPHPYEAGRCVLYHNEGQGRFKDVSTSSGIGKEPGKALGVTVWDYDDDGWPDIFVANDTTAGFLFRNQGNGTFQEVGSETGVAFDEEGKPHSGMGIDADDVFNDGGIRLIITNFQGQQTSFYNQTSPGIFRDEKTRVGIGPATQNVLGFGVFFFDFDNDGFKDGLQVNGHVDDTVEKREGRIPYAQPTQLFQNRRTGTFQEVGSASGKPFSTPLVGRGCAWGDYDNDGRPDVLITTNNGPALLWRNETETKNHWLTLKLIGQQSNRNGIGATVRVKTDGGTQRTLVRSGSSYLSQSDLRPHFGLGASDKADIEIHWPSGQRDRFSQVAADRFWTAQEGAKALQESK